MKIDPSSDDNASKWEALDGKPFWTVDIKTVHKSTTTRTIDNFVEEVAASFGEIGKDFKPSTSSCWYDTKPNATQD